MYLSMFFILYNKYFHMLSQFLRSDGALHTTDTWLTDLGGYLQLGHERTSYIIQVQVTAEQLVHRGEDSAENVSPYYRKFGFVEVFWIR